MFPWVVNFVLVGMDGGAILVSEEGTFVMYFELVAVSQVLVGGGNALLALYADCN